MKDQKNTLRVEGRHMYHQYLLYGGGRNSWGGSFSDSSARKTSLSPSNNAALSLRRLGRPCRMAPIGGGGGVASGGLKSSTVSREGPERDGAQRAPRTSCVVFRVSS